jgi:hypothetical protein
MTKRKRDSTDETKEANAPFDEDIVRTVKWLCLHPLVSLRKDVLGNPNLLGTVTSFLDLQGNIDLGKSHKGANQMLLKGDRGKKLKKTATTCCLCASKFTSASCVTFVRGVDEFKTGYYCLLCKPHKCARCLVHFKYINTVEVVKDGQQRSYCKECYLKLPVNEEEGDEEEEEDEETYLCGQCGDWFSEEDMDGDRCDGCVDADDEDWQPENQLICKWCDMVYREGKDGSNGCCSRCTAQLSSALK